jgi:hypothetical protein
MSSMKRIPDSARSAPGRSDKIAEELDGFIDLGMKREALRAARRALKEPRINAPLFRSALNALLTHTERLKPWSPLVEAAYARLSKRSQQSVRFWMLSLHCSTRNYQAASRFIPRRFVGDFGLTEMAFAMETLLELGRLDQAGKLAKRLPRAIDEATHPLMQSQLLLCLGEYFARRGKWDQAVAIWEAVQFEPTFSQNAVISIVEIHAARALRALQQGLQLIARFKQQFDPALETTLPGNDRAIQEKAQRSLRELQKILERIVTEERRKELGIV